MLTLSCRKWHNVDVNKVVNEISVEFGRHERWDNIKNALEGLEPSSLRAMRENTILYKLLLNSIVYRVTQR